METMGIKIGVQAQMIANYRDDKRIEYADDKLLKLLKKSDQLVIRKK